MECPNDKTTLVMSERSGIEIDYCPQCRGVWLDRGELDKIIDKNSQSAQPHAAPASPAPGAAHPGTLNSPTPHSSHPVPGQEYFDDRESRARYEGPNYRDSDHSYKDHDKSHGYGKHDRKHKKESFLSDLFDF